MRGSFYVRSYPKSSILTVAAIVAALVPVTAFAQQPPAAPGTPNAAGAPGGRGGGRGRGGAPRPPAGPTPRLPDDPYLGANAGKPDLGGNSQSIHASMRGIWNVPYIVDMQKQGRTVDGKPIAPEDVPFTPKGKAAYDLATATNSKDDPEGFCLPPGVPRMMYTPYPAEIFQLPNRIVFVYEGGAHVWRNIWMDGREQPKDPNPTYLGYSVGKWEGDTLVVDTIGMNDRTWLDAAGHQHGEKLHVTEKYTRTDSNTLRIEATIEDPEYYTKPWTVVTTATWSPNNEILEYICQENNRDLKHLVGNGSK
jgi:hypothetical protein